MVHNLDGTNASGGKIGRQFILKSVLFLGEHEGPKIGP